MYLVRPSMKHPCPLLIYDFYCDGTCQVEGSIAVATVQTQKDNPCPEGLAIEIDKAQGWEEGRVIVPILQTGNLSLERVSNSPKVA